MPGTWLKILAPNQMYILKFPVNVSYPVCPRRSIIINSLFVSPADIDECLSSNGFCAQQCINTAGSYSCRCNHGFFLDSNGRTCSGKFKCSFLGWRYLIKFSQLSLKTFLIYLLLLIYINRVVLMSLAWDRALSLLSLYVSLEPKKQRSKKNK